ncbi:MAG: hypothetical protein OXK80_00025 [Bdellovibrionales bacterium]|nr:hypothetical protein [Bdellovibrionales bacterium]
MFRFRNYIGSKKGSLVLSLVAAGTVATTIVATHQVAQRFASGAVGAFNQQQAYLLAQRSLAIAGLMVNRNIVLCSNMPVSGGMVTGCNWKEPLSSDQVASDLYNDLDIDATLFTNYDNIELHNRNAYAQWYLTLDPDDSHRIFKKAEITWALRSLKDTNLRSISNTLSTGYVCRHKDTGAVIENGFCASIDNWDPEEKLLGNRDSRLLSDEDKECRTGDTNNNGQIDENDTVYNDSVCDYYADSDGDDSIVFISVKVPYQSTDAEEEETKHLVVNAAIRRPMTIVKTFMEEDSSMCPISCGIATRSHMGSSTVDNPDCVGFISGTESGGQYFQDNIYAVTTKMKAKNYGPGVLYGLQLLKEDIDPRTGLLLGRSMIGFDSPPVEPVHWDYSTPPPSLVQAGERNMDHLTPCYSTSFYSPSLERFAYDCETTNAGEYKNTAGGVVCLKGKSPYAGKSIFASSTPSTLEGDEARDSLSCVSSASSSSPLPTLSNSILTAFEKPCKDKAGTTEACDFARIDEDQVQPTGSEESWCGNAYVTSTETGREERPTAQLTPHAKEDTVFPVANQDNTPLPDIIP